MLSEPIFTPNNTSLNCKSSYIFCCQKIQNHSIIYTHKVITFRKKLEHFKLTLVIHIYIMGLSYFFEVLELLSLMYDFKNS